jgi:HK97 gp10 family phage protein
MASQTAVKINMRALDRLKREAPEKALAVVKKIAFDMVADMRVSMVESPSQPGGPPGVDTGLLKNSIHAEQTGDAQFTVYDGVDYGQHLEFGTVNMPARPFFKPAADRAAQRAPDEFKEAFKT